MITDIVMPGWDDQEKGKVIPGVEEGDTIGKKACF